MKDCLFIGHTGINLSQIRQNTNCLFGENQVVFKAPFNAAIAYLGSYLYRRGFQIDYINSFYDEQSELSIKLFDKPHIVAISTTFCVSIDQIIEMTRFVRERHADACIVVGGAFIVSKMKMLDDMGKKRILRIIKSDIIADTYQGAEVLADIVKIVKGKGDFSLINNIIFRYNNEVVITQKKTVIEDIKNEPIQWEIFDSNSLSEVLVRTSVSCPFSCSYCSFPENAGPYYNLNVESIIKQLDDLQKIQTVKSINFIDDTMNVPVERFKALLKEMIAKKYRLPWSGYIRCQFLDDESVSLMKESGCSGAFLGLESGNQKILDNMNKKVKIDQYVKGMKLLKKYEINTYAFFIIGFPGETLQTANDTFELIQRLQPMFFTIIPWYYDHTTPIWQKREIYDLSGVGDKWKHSTMDSQTAENLAESIKNKVTNSIPMKMHLSFLTQAIDQGISIDAIRKLFCNQDKFN